VLIPAIRFEATSIINHPNKGNIMNAFRLIAAAALLGIAIAAPVQAKVDVVQLPSAALAQGSTFAWAPVAARGYGFPDPAIANEVTADRLQVLTELTLGNKGYRQVADPTTADLLVKYTIVIVPEAQLTPRAMDGTLVLDLIERESGRLVWRATSEKRVTGKDVTQQKLAALLKQMTKSLPAQAHKQPK
jgi:Domain of unknown function (DUF4136)